MKLLNASINNFRLLKELSLTFSTDQNQKLTVIRAANETGKTTCKTALLWGLFGNSALPADGKNFPLFPTDLNGKKKKCEVSVEIEFETDEVISSKTGAHQIEKKRYRLRRTCIEYASNGESVRRESEAVVLLEVKTTGTERVLDSEVRRIIEGSLPEALKDVYFTDGDSAMSFIEAAATQGVKRKRVNRAVEALLGLELLRDTSKHLGNAASAFAQKIDNTDYKKELERLNDRIDGWEEDIEEWESDRSALEEELANGRALLSRTKKKIEEQLKLGDKEKLARQISDCEGAINRGEDNIKKAFSELSLLINSADLSAALLSNMASKGVELLKRENDNKQLPKVSIPIIDELLDSENCFCGADLSPDSSDGKAARERLVMARKASEEADALQQAASGLFYGVRSESFGEERGANWIDTYTSRSSMLQNLQKSLSQEHERLRELIAERDAIDDSSLEDLRETERSTQDKVEQAQMKLGQVTVQIEDAKDRKKEAEEDRKKIEKKVDKTDTSTGKLNIARLSQRIFSDVCEKLVNEELRKVSDEMNRIFLEMIGSDPEKNDLTNVVKAELTDDYDILVYGPNGSKLDPDQGLNGASRRAITLAFILSLTKVSQVEAPNVIDTPLGMTSGFVKRSVLTRTVEEGSQVILFLTHDEISGVEDIIDDFAGKVFTLTNPGHYPKMLVNRPSVEDSRILRCECNHRSNCKVCERILDTNQAVGAVG